MRQRKMILGLLTALLPFSLMGAKCCSSKIPTHSGDPDEPVWVMNPEFIAEVGYIYGSGVSDKAGKNLLLKRKQADANARIDVANRLSQMISDSMVQVLQNSGHDDSADTRAQVRTWSRNVTVEFLADCKVMERWVSCRESIAATLVRIRYTDAERKARSRVNELLTDRLKSKKMIDHLDQELRRQKLGDPDGVTDDHEED